MRRNPLRYHNILKLAAGGLAGWMLLAALPAAAAPPPRLACEQASEAAETAAHLPPGLLLAIGRVESGRYSATLGRVAPWPWAVDFAGTGVLFATKAEAIQAIRGALAAGQQNIDVGCFQVNLGAHPTAFPDLGTALDPAANARFAAGFLSSLHARLGGWPAATAAYHSETAALGQPYLLAVMRDWAAHGGAVQAADPSADPPPADVPDRTWVVMSPVAGLHVIAPGSTILADAGSVQVITPAAFSARVAAAPEPAIHYNEPVPTPR
ncbi:MAG: transglycosylase SLT domain-containing protein [Rhodospirillales bacterium]|jgi:hypothetical protein|nr:transglycosylase SLT domain-containing protein [Rhodospirillales bacterium]